MRFFWQKREETPKKRLEDMVKEEAEEEILDEEAVKECEKVTAEEAQEKSTQMEMFNPLDCFGWREEKTEKWLLKCVNVWYVIISFLWFMLGALTFAPVLFIANKVEVIFKDKVKSLIAAIIIYAVIVGIVIVLFATRNTDKAKEVAETVI